MSDLKDIQLLLIDDNSRYLERLERRLRRYGYQHLTIANNAEDAIQQLTEAHFDVIVADMRMEQTDSGFAVVDKVQGLNLSSMVIILTANEKLEDCYTALKTKRCWDYISKGLEGGNAMEKLHHSIQEAVTYMESWGNAKDKRWISDNMGYLLDKYQGQYIAVMNNRVIEYADSRAKLEERIAEKKLPRFLTLIERVDAALFRQIPAELILFVEGPTDVTYIKTAMQLCDRHDLLQSVFVDAVGNQLGNRGGGKGNLKNGFTFLQENRLLTNKVLFLCDQDVKDNQLPNKGRDFENLFVRQIGDYSAEQKGIEWLFEKAIFEDGLAKGFVKKIEITTTTVEGQSLRVEYDVTNKTNFCHWICHERDNSPADFEQFRPIFGIIDDVLTI